MRRIHIAALALTAGVALGAGAAAWAGQGASPKAYLVAQIRVKDAEAFRAYAPQVQPTLDAFGGRYLARGGATVGLEGAAPAERIVIIEFPSLEAARAHWASDAYRAIAPVRHKAADGPVFLVEGVAP